MDPTESVPGQSEKFLKYWNAVKENPSDFTGWTCLLQTIDQENLLEKGREVYEDFFKMYPYCYGYWKKYADLEKKNGNIEMAQNVFKSGVKAIPLSIDLWIHYLNFMSQNIKEKSDGTLLMRNLFEEAVEAAGLEFRSDKLWDAYIDWEKANGNMTNVLKIYDRLLSSQTQQYIKHFTKFKELVNNNKPSEILTTEEYVKLLNEVESIPPGVSLTDDTKAAVVADTAPPGEEDAGPPGESTSPIADVRDVGEHDSEEDKYTMDDDNENAKEQREEEAETEAIRAKIISSRELIFKQTEEEIKKRWHFEDAIKRPYFHVKPLERIQLRNWREYLDFEQKEGNHTRICALFERCLIACALYEEFWLKYIHYLESMDDDNEESIAKTRDVYRRACTIHLTKKPNIMLNWSAFEESHNNIDKARGILNTLDENIPGLIMVTLRRAGLERRIGNHEKAIQVLTEEMDRTNSVDEKSFLAIKCAKLFVKFLKDRDSGSEMLYKALEHDKGNKKLYLHLLDLEADSEKVNPESLDELCSMVENCDDLSSEFKQGFLLRKLEILEDLGTDIKTIANAYDSYQKRYKVKPGAVAAKKRPNQNSNDNQASKVSKTDESQKTENTQGDQSHANISYNANGVASSTTSAYSYNPGVANQWGAYAAATQNTGGYYGWYNPYGAYPQQQAQ